MQRVGAAAEVECVGVVELGYIQVLLSNLWGGVCVWGGRVLEDERQEVWGVTTAATAETQQPYAPVYSNEEPACLLPCS